MKTLDIKEALKLIDKKDIEEQIRLRHNLKSKMIGQLYPSIITNEIIKLNKLL